MADFGSCYIFSKIIKARVCVFPLVSWGLISQFLKERLLSTRCEEREREEGTGTQGAGWEHHQ